MPNQHSLLSPSSSERWLHCPRSARLCEGMADTTSSYASEGTEAHALCEHLLLLALGRNTTDPRPLFKQYSNEMQEATEGYVQYVMEQVADFRAKGIEPAVYVEQRLDLRAFIPDCMGTSDAIVVGGDTVIVIDFKFGNLPVSATSPQLRIYSLGVCELLSCLYDFTRVKTVIVQPRLGTVDEAEITKDELYTWANDTLYKAAEPLGFDTAKVTTPCETDCSALVRVCCAYAGITGLPEGFRTGNMPGYLTKTGAFTELTGSKYQSQSIYLGRGDILVTKTSGHTVVVLTNGRKYEGTVHPVEYALGDRVIRYGCEGQDVKLLQEMLLKLGYDLGSWGCDGDFGDCTDLALRAFQQDAKLDVDGECGPATLDALERAVEALEDVRPTGNTVRITGGNCYLRTAPNTDGKILGVAHRGDELKYTEEISATGWLRVEYEKQHAWVSGKYSKIE